MYIQEEDPEKHCTIEALFDPDITENKIVDAILVMMIFYDLVLIYHNRKGNSKQRILNYIK